MTRSRYKRKVVGMKRQLIAAAMDAVVWFQAEKEGGE